MRPDADTGKRDDSDPDHRGRSDGLDRDVTVIDLLTIDREGADGAVWSLPRGGDLNANLIHLGRGGTVGAHVNDEVDVLLVGIEGAGWVTIDSTRHELRAGTMIAVPKGTERGIEAGTTTDVSYLTVHRARADLHIRG